METSSTYLSLATSGRDKALSGILVEACAQSSLICAALRPLCGAGVLSGPDDDDVIDLNHWEGQTEDSGWRERSGTEGESVS